MMHCKRNDWKLILECLRGFKVVSLATADARFGVLHVKLEPPGGLKA